ncbi:hypothetical protein SAMN02745116_01037 [Pilibacter termitis]|uniref:Polymerase beta nucleotidyltransferase domain-containing protein n=1 Tax=Pilibacter termitis TaxID=263852 RepID=A0A1T4MCH5_9ENTE|nr:nucleotidyltransferase domain-containing protein [Pilibacter termitis]SJZ64434.1 hypothetical protein SAMN02745116_01037 [Pilibacter termitis]
MVYTIEEIKEKVRPIAEKYEVPKIYIFGSYAKGQADSESDVDILYQKKGSKVIGFVKYEFQEELEKTLGLETDIITLESLNHEKNREHLPLFIGRVEHDKVLIYEK